jgi:hypothetical protein
MYLPQLSGCVPSPRVIDSRSPSADVFHCTSRHQNAHVTESRVVLYRWHPWHDRTVLVFGAVSKGEEPVFRCALDPADVARPLEVPQWMFDAATCCRNSLTVTPSASVAALRALDALLGPAVTAAASTVLKAEHRSRSATGGAYATPERFTPTRSTDAVSSETDAPPVAEFSVGGPRTHAAASCSVSPTSSSRTARRAGGAR